MHRPLIATAVTLLVLAMTACGDSAEEASPQVLIGGPSAVATSAPSARALGAVATPEAEAAIPTRSPAIVSLDWLAAEAALPGLPSVASAQPDGGLAAAVRTALTGAPGKTSVVVHNLRDGRYAAFNENEVYYAASLFKLGILYEVYRQRDAGLLDMSRLLTLEPKYAEHDLGTLESLGLIPGDQLTVADAVAAMAIVSDTPTGVLLQDTVGCDAADQTLKSLGMLRTEFCNRDLPATAADMTRLLIAVAGGVGVTDASRNEMISLISQEYYRQGIIAGVPEGTFVAHKSGSYSGATHDVALVWSPAGPYAISVLTDQPSNWTTIAEVSSAVWSYFEANPG